MDSLRHRTPNIRPNPDKSIPQKWVLFIAPNGGPIVLHIKLMRRQFNPDRTEALRQGPRELDLSRASRRVDLN